MCISPTNKCMHKRLEETKYMSFLIKDDELLKKYDKIWEKCYQKRI